MKSVFKIACWICVVLWAYGYLAFQYRLYLVGFAGVLFFTVLLKYYDRLKTCPRNQREAGMLMLGFDAFLPGVLIYIALTSHYAESRGGLLHGSLVILAMDVIPVFITFLIMRKPWKQVEKPRHAPPTYNIPNLSCYGCPPPRSSNSGSPYNSDYYRQQSYGPRVIHHEPRYTMFTGDTSGMNGFEFEKYCADLLRNTNQFVNVDVTPKSGDYGADIVARDRKGHVWVWQCKSFKSKLGNSPIQEVVAAKAHYRADAAGVITNSTFTDAARKLANENGVVLIDKNGIPTVGNRRYSYSGGTLTYGEMMFYDLINGD